MASMAGDSRHRHRLTVRDYYRMAEVGILRAEAHVELIEGEIIDMAPVGSRHAGTVKQLVSLLQRAAGESAIVQVQDPISLDRYSEPQPDLALLRWRDDYYKSGHPQSPDVLLAIEVADTSLEYDRDVKVPLYARHGVPEVWLVDVRGKRLTRYRDPVQGEYTSVDQPDLHVALGIGGFARVRIELGAIFGE